MCYLRQWQRVRRGCNSEGFHEAHVPLIQLMKYTADHMRRERETLNELGLRNIRTCIQHLRINVYAQISHLVIGGATNTSVAYLLATSDVTQHRTVWHGS